MATGDVEAEAFLALVRSFNERDEAPTDWDVHVHAGADGLTRLIEARRGEIVIFAGRNDTKLATIRRLRFGYLIYGEDDRCVAQNLALLDAALQGGRELFPG